jgi:hypothetical protein
MRIAQVRGVPVRVPDPMRPGRTALVERLEDAGATAISHPSGNFTAGDDGFFEVPADVAADLIARQYPGGFRFLPEGAIEPGLIKPRKESESEPAKSESAKSRRSRKAAED